MNITKTLAAQIAEQMVKPLKEIANSKFNKWDNDVRAYWVDALPKQVKQVFNSEHRSHIRYSNVSFYGMGLGHYQARRVHTPWPSHASDEYVLKPEQEWIATQWLEAERYRDTVRETEAQIEQQLLALRTFKRVRAEWPEAAAFLPAETSTALTVSVKPLNDKLAALAAVGTDAPPAPETH